MTTNRFGNLFDDDLGNEVLKRSYDLTIRITKCCGDVCGSFKLEGRLSLEREDNDDQDEDGDTEDEPRDELDVKLLRRLLDRFEKVEK